MNELIIKAVIVLILCVCFSCSTKDYTNACNSYCSGKLKLGTWDDKCECVKGMK